MFRFGISHDHAEEGPAFGIEAGRYDLDYNQFKHQTD